MFDSLVYLSIAAVFLVLASGLVVFPQRRNSLLPEAKAAKITGKCCGFGLDRFERLMSHYMGTKLIFQGLAVRSKLPSEPWPSEP
jgi:hypothetical protein